MNLVRNRDLLQRFLQTLPTLLPTEVYQVELLYRTKFRDQPGPSTVLKRAACTKEDLYGTILGLENFNYTYKGQALTEDDLGIYMRLNPRCEVKAAKMLQHILLDIPVINKRLLEVELHRCYTKSRSRKIFIIADYDQPHLNGLSLDCTIVKTRHGYHAHIPISEQTELDWYQKFRSTNFDVVGDLLTPIPGTCQGDFMPYIL